MSRVCTPPPLISPWTKPPAFFNSLGVSFTWVTESKMRRGNASRIYTLCWYDRCECPPPPTSNNLWAPRSGALGGQCCKRPPAPKLRAGKSHVLKMYLWKSDCVCTYNKHDEATPHFNRVKNIKFPRPPDMTVYNTGQPAEPPRMVSGPRQWGTD